MYSVEGREGTICGLRCDAVEVSIDFAATKMVKVIRLVVECTRSQSNKDNLYL
jgi:hypothetical protein